MLELVVLHLEFQDLLIHLPDQILLVQGQEVHIHQLDQQDLQEVQLIVLQQPTQVMVHLVALVLHPVALVL